MKDVTQSGDSIPKQNTSGGSMKVPLPKPKGSKY